MELILVNAVGRVRRVVENGREYLVAPMTLIVPGVLNGSQGALYYPHEENRKPSWNRIPITVRHPYDPVTNQPLSAKSEGVKERQGIGEVRNDRYKGKLVAEGWFDVQRMKAVDERVYNALKAGQRLELSTGLFTRNDPSPGTYNGRAYTHIARDHRPDHLAVLPDEVGACSVRDGCGVLVNQSGGEDVSDPIRNSFWSWLGGVLRITANADQMKHLETGQFLNKGGKAGTKQTHAAAEKGLKKTSGHEQPPADDPDDDGDQHATVVGQGDRSDGTTEPTSNEALMYGQDPHQTSKDAAVASMDHPEAREHAVGAVDASNDDDPKAAAKFHAKAADVHEQAAVDARVGKEPDAADEHDRAAALHRKAAGMHSASALTRNADDKPLKPKKAVATGSAQAASDVEAQRAKITDNDDDETMNKKKGDCAMNRTEKLAKLTANCKCDKEKSVFNKMDDETLDIVFNSKVPATNAKAEGSNADAKGSGTDQAGGEEEDDEAADAKFKGSIKKKGVMNTQQWLAEAPPEIQSVVQNAINVESHQKSQLVNRLVANVANEQQRTRLTANLMMKSIGELRDLSMLTPAPVQRTAVRNNDYQPDPLYVGVSGGGVDAITDNAAGDDTDDVLDFTANRAAVAEEFAARRTG